jgi:hypothetical protein
MVSRPPHHGRNFALGTETPERLLDLCFFLSEWVNLANPLKIVLVILIEHDGVRTAWLHSRYRRIEDTGILIAKNLLKIRETLKILKQSSDWSWNKRDILLEEKRFHVHP